MSAGVIVGGMERSEGVDGLRMSMKRREGKETREGWMTASLKKTVRMLNADADRLLQAIKQATSKQKSRFKRKR